MLFFGVAWHATADECRAFVREFDVPYENGLDTDESVFRAYRFNYQPNTVLIDTDGRIVERIVGPVGHDRLAALVDALIEA